MICLDGSLPLGDLREVGVHRDIAPALAVVEAVGGVGRADGGQRQQERDRNAGPARRPHGIPEADITGLELPTGENTGSGERGEREEPAHQNVNSVDFSEHGCTSRAYGHARRSRVVR